MVLEGRVVYRVYSLRGSKCLSLMRFLADKLSFFLLIILVFYYLLKRTLSIRLVFTFSVVTRIEARSEKCGMLMQLDVNTEIYPIDKEEKFLMALSTTLSLEVILFSSSLHHFGRHHILFLSKK